MRPEDIDKLSAENMGIQNNASQPMIGKNANSASVGAS